MNNNDINFSFLKMENNKTNMIYSPLSIKYALSMLRDGTNSDTKQEIENVLNNCNITKYDNIDKVLSLANAIFIRDSFKYSVKEEFINSLYNKYNASVKYDSFIDYTNIDNWVNNTTMGQIDKLFGNQIPDKSLNAILINALAVNMQWDICFDFYSICGDIFKCNYLTKIVTMMHNKYNSLYIKLYNSNDETVISLGLREYNGTKLEFIGIMPSNSLDSYINNFNNDKYSNILNNLTNPTEYDNVLLAIPKFSYSYELSMKDDLNNLGINKVFTREADLSGITNEDLIISDAIHNANIDFSEEGIKAAAVTSNCCFGSNLLEKERNIIINFNKPFMYIIRDTKTGEIWFVGTVYEPNLWDEDKELYEIQD